MKKEFTLILDWEINSPYVELRIATGRAKCRICGEKIVKGDDDVQFAHSFTDGGSYNSWTAVDCHAHKKCVPDLKIEYDWTEEKKKAQARVFDQGKRR